MLCFNVITLMFHKGIKKCFSKIRNFMMRKFEIFLANEQEKSLVTNLPFV